VQEPENNNKDSRRSLGQKKNLNMFPYVGSYAISLIVINTERQVGKKGRNSGRSGLEEERKQRDLTVLSPLAARDQRD